LVLEQKTKARMIMKREEVVHIAITRDEMASITRKMAEKMIEDGKKITISTFLREFAIKPFINGECSPSEITVPEETAQDPDDKRWDDINF